MYETLPTEKLIIRLRANNIPRARWVEMDNILFARAEKGDKQAENYYLKQLEG